MLNTREVAALLNRHPDTIKEWRQIARRTGRKIGPPYVQTETGRILYDEQALHEWQQSRTVSA